MPDAENRELAVLGRPPELQVVRVLVIDDDSQAAALIEMALAEAHFQCELDIASTATEGLRRIADNAHDIYLVDYRLPDKTGVELIHEAKARGADKPFILMTGYGSGEIDDAALREGAADYVEKHLVGTYLDRAIRYALRDWQADRAIRDREEQLRQAQKMEAIGRLAGGIAHDFNNLLTAIVGYTDLVLERLHPNDVNAHDVAEIRNAADRAASLTRQLLTFSRKQFLQPVVLNLNEAAGGVLNMLPRVIGAHIKTRSALDPQLRYVKADPGQIEQVLLNLALNARDAMAQGGELTITTKNVEMTREQLGRLKLVLPPGQYVMLAISDTGAGMDAETLSRAFEPFFTTKPKGKGTGLGLATVYGIVDQSGGAISIDTAVGRGTTVRVYLPAATETTLPATAATAPRQTGGNETILLVEDNDAVRTLVRHTLHARGYDVIEARDAEQALDWVASGNDLDLLLTDVVMPGLSGPNLAARLLQSKPTLRVLYMSGYSGDIPSGHGALWVGVPLIQKPFTPQQLAERVRSVLDTSTRHELP